MGTQEFIKSANRKLAPKVVKNLQARHFDAYFCETADEALEKQSNSLIKTEQSLGVVQ